MAKDEQTMKFIRDRYFELNLTDKEFLRRYHDAVNKSGKEDPTVDISYVNKWRNKKSCPQKSRFPFIAEALEVTVEELSAGKISKERILQQEIEKLNQIKNSNDNETKLVISLIWPNRNIARYWSTLLYVAFLFYFNYTHWNNTTTYIFCLIIFLIAPINDQKNIFKETNHKHSNYNYLNIFNTLIMGIKLLFKLYKQKNLIAYVIISKMFIISLLLFLPIFELAFYRGSCDVSMFLYLIIGTILLIKSFKD